AVGAPAARVAERLGLAVGGRVAALHPLVVTAPQERAGSVEQGSPDRDPALGLAGARLLDRDLQHPLVIHAAGHYPGFPVPTAGGLTFSSSLHPLEPGRMPFRRWRWELWHGATMVAAGWRLTQAQAGRALRLSAAEFGHRLFGLPGPAREPADGH